MKSKLKKLISVTLIFALFLGLTAFINDETIEAAEEELDFGGETLKIGAY